MDRSNALSELHAALGYKPLNRLWAKLEIVFGLAAAGVGIGLGTSREMWPIFAVAGLVLFVLGGYLALAGNRSHLYQSNNELIAYLAQELRTSK
jgi:hypothetical protein